MAPSTIEKPFNKISTPIYHCMTLFPDNLNQCPILVSQVFTLMTQLNLIFLPKTIAPNQQGFYTFSHILYIQV